jgi:hypothetical protein
MATSEQDRDAWLLTQGCALLLELGVLLAIGAVLLLTGVLGTFR